MASIDSDQLSTVRGVRGTPAETGPFVLRTLIEDLPLSADGDRDDIEINCVEYLDHNLYIGTSASELLHFFEIPSDPGDISGKPSYILASRLSPAYNPSTAVTTPGVQQILLLPRVNKACVLCNWVVTFYSLPELSPVFNTAQVPKCSWIGGLDLNKPRDSERGGQDAFEVVLLSLRSKIRVVRIGVNQPSPIKAIEFAGSTISVRRDSFACVADAHSYALLDVDRQLKIPLFPISSLDESQNDIIGGQVQDISTHAGGGISRSVSAARSTSSRPATDDRGHGRSTSLGSFVTHSSRGADLPTSGSDQSGISDLRETPTNDSHRPLSHTTQSDKPLPVPPAEASSIDSIQARAATTSAPVYLKPHIVSPSPEEFLLVTGTRAHEPGVGLFVNLEGDVTRSTLQFDRYPDEVVVDGRGVGIELTPINHDEAEEGFVLASMSRDSDKGLQHGIEIQRWDLDPGDNQSSKFWLEPISLGPQDTATLSRIGLRSTTESGMVYFHEVTGRLRLRRFKPFAAKSRDTSNISLRSVDSRTASSLERVSAEQALFESGEILAEGWEERRMGEELQFAQRLGHTKSHIVAWSGKQIWWVVRNPLALRLDASLLPENDREQHYAMLDRRKVIGVIDHLRGTEAKTETEFLSLIYMKQRAGLLLFMSILAGPHSQFLEIEYQTAEEALLEGGLDPRIILAIVPLLREEIIEGKTGIWVHGGIKDAADNFIQRRDVEDSDPQHRVVPASVLLLLKRFLSAWRRRKGFGSVANENEVFKSIDAALLVVLLRLDESSPKGIAEKNSIRAELNDLVDHGLDCFERAVSLLESHHRLYVLSRLYQSRRMAEEVLETWRRILEGAVDNGGEFVDGEQQLRDYLSKISNPQLVQRYGVWLAARNPKLGVQVFAEDRGRVKFGPTQVVEILREGAPSAVKDYLEHLVFGKNRTEYVNELIAYYLDIVINKLENSEVARIMLTETYIAYRALRPPKPTYRHFIIDNSIDEEWWHSRLRLLQLLGGSQGSASNYDVGAILERLTPFTKELVPEIIILKGRQSEHAEALRLLTHGLGDYDTAITYCLLGGSSIYHPMSGTVAQELLPTKEEQSKLFNFLLLEFLKIEDASDRVEQTSNLLERFGGWFDVYYVLSLIPDSWSVELISGFLVSALRRIVQERSETVITKSLSGSENLRTSADLIEKIKAVGPSVDT
ncbi:hypothetical protein F5884DRAFT_696562 [Xylogone sp. PMI_703]|nr:hypothetical protein F5884DRAFT_696562 [Xylogone sp. PMI_703]